MEKDLALFKAPEETRDGWSAKPHDMEMLPEAVDALKLFLALGTQWRHAGMDGQPVGLDYAAVGPAAKAIGVELTPERFADLAAMEQAALAALRERRASR